MANKSLSQRTPLDVIETHMSMLTKKFLQDFSNNIEMYLMIWQGMDGGSGKSKFWRAGLPRMTLDIGRCP
jgi:hypothetical protein